MRRCGDAKMRICGDAGMWRCEDANMQRCADADMWRCGDSGMRIYDIIMYLYINLHQKLIYGCSKIY